MAPRGIRNNNPGNIEYGRFARSMGATGSDGRFAIFPTPEAGINAIRALQTTYENKYGLKSPTERIGRWAPSFENNVSAYANAVAGGMDINANDPFSFVDANMEDDVQFVAAMIRHENGSQPYSLDQIRNALASGSIPRPTSAAKAAAVASGLQGYLPASQVPAPNLRPPTAAAPASPMLARNPNPTGWSPTGNRAQAQPATGTRAASGLQGYLPGSQVSLPALRPTGIGFPPLTPEQKAGAKPVGPVDWSAKPTWPPPGPPSGLIMGSGPVPPLPIPEAPKPPVAVPSGPLGADRVIKAALAGDAAGIRQAWQQILSSPELMTNDASGVSGGERVQAFFANIGTTMPEIASQVATKMASTPALWESVPEYAVKLPFVGGKGPIRGPIQSAMNQVKTLAAPEYQGKVYDPLTGQYRAPVSASAMRPTAAAQPAPVPSASGGQTGRGAGSIAPWSPPQSQPTFRFPRPITPGTEISGPGGSELTDTDLIVDGVVQRRDRPISPSLTSSKESRAQEWDEMMRRSLGPQAWQELYAPQAVGVQQYVPNIPQARLQASSSASTGGRYVPPSSSSSSRATTLPMGGPGTFAVGAMPPAKPKPLPIATAGFTAPRPLNTAQAAKAPPPKPTTQQVLNPAWSAWSSALAANPMGWQGTPPPKYITRTVQAPAIAYAPTVKPQNAGLLGVTPPRSGGGGSSSSGSSSSSASPYYSSSVTQGPTTVGRNSSGQTSYVSGPSGSFTINKANNTYTSLQNGKTFSL